MNLLLKKCLLICLMLGVSLQGIGAPFVSECKHSGNDTHALGNDIHVMATTSADHSHHTSSVAKPDPHEHHHAMIADDAHVTDQHVSYEHGTCDECRHCASCIAPPIPAQTAGTAASVQAPGIVASDASLFADIVLEDPPRPPSIHSSLI